MTWYIAMDFNLSIIKRLPCITVCLHSYFGNKRNHFLFFVLSLVLIGKPWYIQIWDVLNVYVLACLYDIALFYHVMLIYETKINQSINQFYNKWFLIIFAGCLRSRQFCQCTKILRCGSWTMILWAAMIWLERPTLILKTAHFPSLKRCVEYRNLTSR